MFNWFLKRERDRDTKICMICQTTKIFGQDRHLGSTTLCGCKALEDHFALTNNISYLKKKKNVGRSEHKITLKKPICRLSSHFGLIMILLVVG